MWRWACAVALLCAALTQADELQREDKPDKPFVLGSRYGRSAPRLMSPRNDRFFMSSRYGKRSGAAEALRCDCGVYRVALLALRAHCTRRPPARLLHQD